MAKYFSFGTAKWSGYTLRLAVTGGAAQDVKFVDGKFLLATNGRELKGLPKSHFISVTFAGADGRPLTWEVTPTRKVSVQTSVSGQLTDALGVLSRLLSETEGRFVAVRVLRDTDGAKAGDVAFQVALPFMDHILDVEECKTIADPRFQQWLHDSDPSVAAVEGDDASTDPY